MHGTLQTAREQRIARMKEAAKQPRIKRPWTDADINNLRIWWWQGKLLKVICDKLERTHGSVLCKVHRLGLPSRRKHRKRRVNVEITDTAYTNLRRRATERETTIAGYVRYLISRDLGETT